MATLQLKAQVRELTGRKVRQLRNQGLVPVVVYGAAQAPAILQVDARSLERTLHSGGASQLVEVLVDGGTKHNVLIRQVQREPVSHSPIHADFYAVNMREKQQVTVPIHPVGKALALTSGWMILQALDHVEIEALPADIPGHIEVDITDLTMDHAIHVADLPKLAGIDYLAESDEVVFTMITTHAGESDEEEGAGDLVEPELVGREEDEDE